MVTKQIGKYTGAYIGQGDPLNDEILTQAFNELSEGDDLFIERRGKGINFECEGVGLIKNGFVNIVKMKHCDTKGNYMIHCKRGKDSDRKQLLSVIVPLYNEENTAGELLDKLINRQWNMDVEFVLVESNSKDRTREIALSYSEHPNVKIILEDKPAGKGNGVLNGIKHASGNYIAIQDGDLEYDVNDYDKLLEPIINYDTLFVLGSRHNKDDWHMRKFGNSGKMIADYLNIGQVFLTWVLNTACGCKLSDPFTMYKIFHKDCMYGINFKGGNFGLDWELVIRYIRKGYVPVELPVIYNARSYEEGKHIELFKTPIEGLKALWRCRYASSVYDYGDD